MKAFDLVTFNQDGTSFIYITARYTHTGGIEVVAEEKQVSKRPNVCPASGCDFVSHSGSTSSNLFYEVSGLPEINDLFMPTKARFYVYALPENKDQVLGAVHAHINKFIADKAAQYAADADHLLTVVKGL